MASKGIISGATVTAYCGGQKASPQVVIGTATTDANGNYSITPTATCALPVEVVLTPKAGATMLDEATGLPVTLPSTFTMRAYIANPGTTISTNITPFTDMAATAVNNSSSAPSAANVGAAINAVVKSVLGGDDLLYNAKPVKPADANSSTDPEVKKLSALLTAISAHANSLLITNAAGATDTGSATLLALKELEDSARTTITVSSTGASVTAATGSLLAPADIMNHDITDAGFTTYNANPDAEKIATSAPILTVYTGPITATTPGITTATKLFTSLRSNLVLLSNSGKTGFIDTQVSAIRTGGFNGMGRTITGIDQFGYMASTARDLLRNPGISMQMSKGGYCTVSSPALVSCSWGMNSSVDVSGNFVTLIHQTTFNPTAAATPGTSYDWSDQLQTTTYNPSNPFATTTPTASNSFTGTVTTSSGSASNFIAFNGNVAGLDSTADHSNISLTGTETTVGSNKVLALTGGVNNYDASNVSQLALTFGAGSQIVAIPGTATTSAQPVSANIIITAASPSYQFDGKLTIPSFVQDTSQTSQLPGSLTFTGSITNLTNATVGKFMTGTMSETTTLTGYNATLPISSTNFKKLNFVFAGSVINGTVTPATTYTVGLNVDETVYAQRGLSFTYTDPSGNAVTVSTTIQNGSTPTTLTASSGGVTVIFTKGSGGQVFAGDPTNAANLIGTISANTVNFTDGSFISLM